MPTYEYRCDKCGHEFEREQRITEDPIKTCPKCKAQKARRLISVTSFVLKGGGWYADLYSSGGKKKGDGESKAGESTAASSSTSTDSTSSTSADSGTKSESKSGSSDTKSPSRKKSGKSAAA